MCAEQRLPLKCALKDSHSPFAAEGRSGYQGYEYYRNTMKMLLGAGAAVTQQNCSNWWAHRRMLWTPPACR